MVLAILISMVVSADKTVNSYLNSPTGEGSSMGKEVFNRESNQLLNLGGCQSKS